MKSQGLLVSDLDAPRRDVAALVWDGLGWKITWSVGTEVRSGSRGRAGSAVSLGLGQSAPCRAALSTAHTLLPVMLMPGTRVSQEKQEVLA